MSAISVRLAHHKTAFADAYQGLVGAQTKQHEAFQEGRFLSATWSSWFFCAVTGHFGVPGLPIWPWAIFGKKNKYTLAGEPVKHT